MSDYQDAEFTEVATGQAPALPAVITGESLSLAVALSRAEVDQQISTAKAFPRDIRAARNEMITVATLDESMAEECVYALPRGGKTIRGPSIRFAELVVRAWGNTRSAARVTHVDRIERFVEAEAVVHDLQSNNLYTARVRRTIELKKNRRSIDADMVALAGAAAMSIARRNAILATVPKGVWKSALDAVESVNRGDQKTLSERRDAAVGYFNKIGVDTPRVLRKLEVQSVEEITLDDLMDLQALRTSVKSGEHAIDELFPAESGPTIRPKGTEETLKALAGVDPETGEIKAGLGHSSIYAQNEFLPAQIWSALKKMGGDGNSGADVAAAIGQLRADKFKETPGHQVASDAPAGAPGVVHSGRQTLLSAQRSPSQSRERAMRPPGYQRRPHLPIRPKGRPRPPLRRLSAVGTRSPRKARALCKTGSTTCQPKRRSSLRPPWSGGGGNWRSSRRGETAMRMKAGIAFYLPLDHEQGPVKNVRIFLGAGEWRTLVEVSSREIGGSRPALGTPTVYAATYSSIQFYPKPDRDYQWDYEVDEGLWRHQTEDGIKKCLEWWREREKVDELEGLAAVAEKQ